MPEVTGPRVARGATVFGSICRRPGDGLGPDLVGVGGSLIGLECLVRALVVGVVVELLDEVGQPLRGADRTVRSQELLDGSVEALVLALSGVIEGRMSDIRAQSPGISRRSPPVAARSA